MTPALLKKRVEFQANYEDGSGSEEEGT